MKRLILLFCSLTFLFSCKEEYKPRTIKNITIQSFKKEKSSIRAIQAISKDTLIFASSLGDISKTFNGGKTWITNYIKYNDSVTPHFRSIAQTKNGLFALSIGNPALLYKLGDQKDTIVYIENHEKVFYDAMVFFDDKDGIAIGDPTASCTSIILTNDGGETWNKIPCDKLPSVEDGEASFAASNTNIAIINNTVWVATGGKKARILKSSDRGLTWSIFDTPIIQGNGPQGIYSVDFYDENNGIIIGGDYTKPELNKGNKAVTKDGGKTWTLIAEGQDPDYRSCIQYVPGTQGKEVFAVGKTGISFSNDSGKTWTKVSEDSYFSIQFVDKNNAWLSGHEKIGKLKL